MGHLMVGNGEDFAGATIEQFKAQFLPQSKPALLAEKAVEMDGGIDGIDSIFRKKHDLNATSAEEGNEIADNGVDFGEIAADLGMSGAEAL